MVAAFGHWRGGRFGRMVAICVSLERPKKGSGAQQKMALPSFHTVKVSDLPLFWSLVASSAERVHALVGVLSASVHRGWRGRGAGRSHALSYAPIHE